MWRRSEDVAAPVSAWPPTSADAALSHGHRGGRTGERRPRTRARARRRKPSEQNRKTGKQLSGHTAVPEPQLASRAGASRRHQLSDGVLMSNVRRAAVCDSTLAAS